jgi:hypothetical protein
MRPRRIFAAAFAALLLSSACADDLPTAGPAAAPSLAVVPDESGVYRDDFDLPYELEDTWVYAGGTFGSHARHEEFVLPPGTYDLEIAVHGGLIVHNTGKATLEYREVEETFIGPGGIIVSWPWAFPTKYLWNVTLNRIGPDSRGIDRLTTVWSAPVGSADSSAFGKVRVQGGARFVFSRAVGTTGFPYDWYIFHGWLYAETNQRASLVARPINTGNIKLSCTGDLGPNRVTRGKQINCTAEKDPANATGALTVTEWSFNGAPRTDGDPTSSTWGGIMVTGGTVQVKGRVATATIAVVDRPSPEVPLLHQGEELGATGGEARVPALPSEIAWAKDLGETRFFAEPPPGVQLEDPIQQVSGGPNDRLAYFGDLSFPVWVYVRINTGAMARGSAFYNAQEQGSSSGGTRVGGTRWCSRRVVNTTLPDQVRAHERRHVEIYQQYYAQVVRPELTALEQMTGTYSELADRYEVLRANAGAEAHKASKALDSEGHPERLAATEDGRPCALKNENGAPLRNPPQEDAG